MCYYRDFISGCQVNSRPSRSPRPDSQSAAIRGSFSLSSGSRAEARRRIPASPASGPNRVSTRRPSSAPVPSKHTAAGISPLSGRMGAPNSRRSQAASSPPPTGAETATSRTLEHKNSAARTISRSTRRPRRATVP